MFMKMIKDHGVLVFTLLVTAVFTFFVVKNMQRMNVATKTSQHVCVSESHEMCDSNCECDGLGCPKIDTTEIRIYPTNNFHNGRQKFSVEIGDSLYMDYMFPEEIAQALITGKWEYNENLRVK